MSYVLNELEPAGSTSSLPLYDMSIVLKGSWPNSFLLAVVALPALEKTYDLFL